MIGLWWEWTMYTAFAALLAARLLRSTRPRWAKALRILAVALLVATAVGEIPVFHHW